MNKNRWTEIRTSGSGLEFCLLGDWTLENISTISQELPRESAFPPTGSVVANGGRLGKIDTAGAMLLLEVLGRGTSVQEIELREFSDSHASIYQLALQSVAKPSPIKRSKNQGFLTQLGIGSVDAFRAGQSILSFIGLTFVELLRALCHPRSLRLKELSVQIEECGLNAVPIVCLVNFLIGIVIAYLSGVQLEYYGANIFVVDGVALAVVRELSPILVAIIAAGRSGSAFTAQIGAMKLNEEVDAIATLGLSPIRVLVMPRILALIIVMPILVFFGDIAGILGGLLIADIRLGVTGATFIDRLQFALTLTHVFAGLAKAPFFAFFIGTIGCRMGLGVENNAKSVGENTTGTVVRSIVVVILLNAAFAVMYSELGI